jgi:hypothetical protein
MNESSHANDTSAPEHASEWLALQQERAPAGHWDEWRGSLNEPVDLLTPTPDEHDAKPATLSAAWLGFTAQQDMATQSHQGAAADTSELNTRMANLQRQVRDNGITYNVYAAADQPQRPWSLDLFWIHPGVAGLVGTAVVAKFTLVGPANLYGDNRGEYGASARPVGALGRANQSVFRLDVDCWSPRQYLA